MTAIPDQRKHATNRPQNDGDDAPKKPADTSTDPKRKQACDDLDERFPEQCDGPLAENEPAQPMPDEKEADSKAPGHATR